MKKIRYIIDFGFAGCQYDEEAEFPDDTSDEDIESYVKEAALEAADGNLSWS